MPNQFKIIHFDYQCPWTAWVIEEAQMAAKELGGSVEVINVKNNPTLAEAYNLCYPFLTIIDEHLRIHAPLRSTELVRVVREGLERKPYKRLAEEGYTVPTDALADEIHPLTLTNIVDTYTLCNMHLESVGCRAKCQWISSGLMPSTFGLVAYVQHKPVGFIEYLPANLIPYPGIKPELDTENIAFITCVHSVTGELNYRAHLIDKLLTILLTQGYQRVRVFTGRHSAFPNGPISVFMKHGFKELGTVDHALLKYGVDEVILMEKNLED